MGVSAVVVHLYPVYFVFRGGKGVATAAGTMAVLAPLALSCCLLLFAVLVGCTRYVSVASVATGMACPLLVLAFGVARHVDEGGFDRCDLVGRNLRARHDAKVVVDL